MTRWTDRAISVGLGAVMWTAGLVACGGSSGGRDFTGGSDTNGGEASGGDGGSATGTGASGGDGGSADGTETSGGEGNAGAGGAAPTDLSPCAAPEWDPADFATVYEVGPGREYATPSDVPWESIGPSTLVRVHRRPTPYADKWAIAVAATASAPVVVLGVPEAGLLPEITGVNAVTRRALSFWSDERGIIKIGGSSVPDVTAAAHVFVECLDISGARGPFIDDGGAASTYADNAAAIFVESGANITLRNNRLHDAGNGLFVAHDSDDIVVSGNDLYDNGNVGSVYEHNSYTEARGIWFEFNRYGELCAGCLGNNLKDRSSGLVVRYNWVTGGNRALDLVDSSYPDINGATDYDDTFVYGNVLVELDDGGNRQLIHYGGDGDPAHFRQGTLHFYHNTVVSERSSLMTVVRLSSAAATLDARNNVFFALDGGSSLALLEDAGTAAVSHSWLPSGWRPGSPSLSGTVTATNSVEGVAPGFVDTAARDYHLAPDAPARGIPGPLANAAAAYPVEHEPASPSGGLPRATTSSAGAFE